MAIRRAADVLALVFAVVFVFALVFAVAWAPRRAVAIGSVDAGPVHAEAIGALRLLGSFARLTPQGRDAAATGPRFNAVVVDDGTAAAVARLVVTGDVRGRLDFEINVFGELASGMGDLSRGSLATAASFDSPYRTRLVSWDFWNEGRVAGELTLDRLTLHAGMGRFDLTAGRMPLNYSVTSLLAPNDFFAPFAASSVNTIYKAGVDGARVSYGASDATTLELTAVAGGAGAAGRAGGDRRVRWADSALLARVTTQGWGVDWQVLAGKLAQRWVAGSGFQANVGRLSWRGEGHVGWPDADGDVGGDVGGDVDGDDIGNDGRRRDDVHVRAATGFDLAWPWHNGSLGIEYGYFSDGAAARAAYLTRLTRLFPDDLPYLGRHYVGLTAGGDLLPILRITGLVLQNVADGSGLGVLLLAASLADEIDCVGGAIIPWGRGIGRAAPIGSEFGLLPISVFLETRFFF